MIDNILTIVTPNPWHFGWNWTGKLVSIAIALIAIRLFKLSHEESGIVSPRREGIRGAALLGLASVIISVIANYLTRDHHMPNMETLAFEATMPGISEELAFRGVLIGLFLRAYGPDQKSGFILAGIASTLSFGFGHGLAFNGTLHLAWLPVIFSAVLGGLFICMRYLTGSIFPSIIAHNVTNVSGDFANGAK